MSHSFIKIHFDYELWHRFSLGEKMTLCQCISTLTLQLQQAFVLATCASLLLISCTPNVDYIFQIPDKQLNDDLDSDDVD
jgi:hypothetical protein